MVTTEMGEGTSSQLSEQDFPPPAGRSRVKKATRGGRWAAMVTTIRWWRVAAGFVGIAVVVGIWWIAALVVGSSVTLPTPADTVGTLIHYSRHPYPTMGNTLLEDAGFSLARILIGFAWGAIAGILIGAAMAGVKAFRWMIDPLIELSRPLPPLAFIPLLIVWFGIGELPKVLLVGMGVVPIMVVTVVAAIDAVPEEFTEAARCLGASRRYALLHVRLRAALPAVITGLRLSMGLSWTSIVAVEMIAATNGLGYVILQAGNYLVTDLIFAGIVLIAVIALILDGLLRMLHRIVNPAG